MKTIGEPLEIVQDNLFAISYNNNMGTTLVRPTSTIKHPLVITNLRVPLPSVKKLPFIKTSSGKSTERIYKTGEQTISLYQKDCLQFLGDLPPESLDVIVTDPAYSGMNNRLNLGKGRIVGKYIDKGKDTGKWFSEFQDTTENYKAFLSKCKKALKKDGHIYIMFDSFSLLSLAPIVREYFDVKNLIVWDKVNVGMGHYYRRRHEFILFATNGNNRNIKHRAFPDIWRIKRIHQAHYPTQKPVEIFDIMVSASAKPGFTVCDPFMGSASAAIAAIKHGCNFIGSDLSEKAINLSATRIETFAVDNIDPLQRNSCVPEGEKIFW